MVWIIAGVIWEGFVHERHSACSKSNLDDRYESGFV